MPDNNPRGSTATIRVCMPLYRSVEPRTFASVWQLSQSDVCLDMELCSDVASARNALAKRLEGEPYLLFVDGDMLFTSQQIEELYMVLKENPKMGALAAHACRWDGSQTPVCGWKKDRNTWMNMEECSELSRQYTRERRVERVDMFGTGVVLIDSRVFKKLPYPWFEFNHKTGMGEDTNFCQRLIAAGYQPSVHFGVPVGHIGPTLWMPEEAHVSSLQEDLEVSIAVQ